MPNAVPSGAGTANLVALKEMERPLRIQMVPAHGGNAQATEVISSLGQMDQLQIAAASLQPGQVYQLSLVVLGNANAQPIVLAKFKANPADTAITQAICPVRHVVHPNTPNAVPRAPLVTVACTNQPVLVQQTG